MTFNRSIASCMNMPQLETLREKVLAYHKDGKEDSAELMANFSAQETALSPETMTIYRKSHTLPHLYRIQGSTLTEVFDLGGKAGVSIDTNFDGSLLAFAPCSKEDFDAMLKKVYNKISINL